MTTNFKSIVFNTDSYKVSMAKQYPPGTEYIYSYVTPRSGDKIVNFGLQKFIREILAVPVTREEVLAAEKFWTAHGEPFNTEDWLYIVDAHKGFLPLMVFGIDEGLVVPAKTPVVTVVNTDPRCFWLTTWVETAMLRDVWYGSTVATNSWEIKQIIADYLDKSGDIAGLPFKLHDFGFRGVSSYESAEVGAAAHLINFMGTDTVAGIFGASKFYDADIYATGWSIPAAEHSTITSWGRGSEALAYENMVKQFSKPGSIYAVVSDSYDIYNAVSNIWGGELKDLVVSSGGTLVIRPDSGDPLEVLPTLISSAAQRFGFTLNDKGYKVLNNVRFIWGDGINKMTIRSILRMIVDTMGYSADNLAFGAGGSLLQGLTRDTYSFAMKASAARINGEWGPVAKDPITDSGKKSMSGMFSVAEDFTVTSTLEGVPEGEANMLKLRYYNGNCYNQIKFDEVRANSNK
jgi:nicotinamide phosphoribosyltransferase